MRRLAVPETIRPKTEWTRTTHLWSHVHDHLSELFIIRRESFIFFSEMGRMLLQRELPRLGTWYRLRAPSGWDTTGRPQVLGRSVKEFVHPISIGSTRWSCLHPQIRIEIGCYMSSRNKNPKSSNSIQENNNLW